MQNLHLAILVVLVHMGEGLVVVEALVVATEVVVYVGMGVKLGVTVVLAMEVVMILLQVVMDSMVAEEEAMAVVLIDTTHMEDRKG